MNSYEATCAWCTGPTPYRVVVIHERCQACKLNSHVQAMRQPFFQACDPLSSSHSQGVAASGSCACMHATAMSVERKRCAGPRWQTGWRVRTSEKVPVNLFSSVDLPTEGKPACMHNMDSILFQHQSGRQYACMHAQEMVARLTNQPYARISHLVHIKACTAQARHCQTCAAVAWCNHGWQAQQPVPSPLPPPPPPEDGSSSSRRILASLACVCKHLVRRLCFDRAQASAVKGPALP